MQTRVRLAAPFAASFSMAPHYLEAQPVWPFREKATLTLQYPTVGVNAGLLAGECEAVWEYYDGAAWVEPLDSRFRLVSEDSDRLDMTRTKSYSFVALVPDLLSKAQVWEAGTIPTDSEGRLVFSGATPGRVMGQLFSMAKARGWGTGLSVNFTDALDSAGVAWGSTINITVEKEQTLWDVLEALASQGAVDWAAQGRVLQLFKPDTALGRNKQSIVLYAAQGETAAPVQKSYQDRATVLRVVGDDGKKWDRANGTSPWGRLERVASASGVTDEGTANLLTNEELTRTGSTRVSRTREFDEVSRYLPHRDFRPGDYVKYQTETGVEVMRVMSVSLTSGERLKGHAVLGDRFEDAMIKAARKANSLVIGSSSSGTGRQPSQTGDWRTPSTPTGLSVSSSIEYGTDNQPIGVVALSWSHTGLATDGTVQAIDRFELEWAAPGGKRSSFRSAQVSPLSVSPVPTRRNGAAAKYDFWIRAVSYSSRASSWFGPVQVTMAQDTTPPPVPVFTVSGERLVFTAAVSGRGVGDVAMPPDYAYTLVEGSTAPSGAPWVALGKVFGSGNVVAQAETMGAITGTGPVTRSFRAASVDSSGNQSAWSPVQSATSARVYDGSDLRDRLTTAEGTLAAADSWIATTGAEHGTRLTTAEGTLAPLPDRLSAAESAISVEIPSAISTAKSDAIASAATDAAAKDAVMKQQALTEAAATAQSKVDAAKSVLDGQILEIKARGTSLHRDPSFETSAGEINVSGGNVSRVMAEPHSGQWSLQYMTSGAGGNLFAYSNFVRVGEGRTIYAECWVKGGNPAPPEIEIWAQARKSLAPTETLPNFVSTVVVVVVVGAWVKVSGFYTLPAGYDEVRVFPLIRSTHNGAGMGGKTLNLDDWIVLDVTEAKAALDAANAAQSAASAAQAAAGAAQNTADSAMLMAGSKSKSYYSTAAPSGTATTVGDVWRQTDASGNVVGRWRWNGSGWVPDLIRNEVIDGLDVGKLSAGTAVINQAVVNKITGATANFQTVDVKNLFATTGTMTEAVIQKLFTDVVVAKTASATAFIGENAIISGAITAAKITASLELSAKVAQFIEVNAEKILGGSFEGETFTGGTFRGSIFETHAALTQGMKLDLNGMRIYRSDEQADGTFVGTPLFEIGVGGDVSFASRDAVTGDLRASIGKDGSAFFTGLTADSDPVFAGDPLVGNFAGIDKNTVVRVPSLLDRLPRGLVAPMTRDLQDVSTYLSGVEYRMAQLNIPVEPYRAYRIHVRTGALNPPTGATVTHRLRFLWGVGPDPDHNSTEWTRWGGRYAASQWGDQDKSFLYQSGNTSDLWKLLYTVSADADWPYVSGGSWREIQMWAEDIGPALRPGGYNRAGSSAEGTGGTATPRTKFTSGWEFTGFMSYYNGGAVQQTRGHGSTMIKQGRDPGWLPGGIQTGITWLSTAATAVSGEVGKRVDAAITSGATISKGSVSVRCSYPSSGRRTMRVYWHGSRSAPATYQPSGSAASNYLGEVTITPGSRASIPLTAEALAAVKAGTFGGIGFGPNGSTDSKYSLGLSFDYKPSLSLTYER